MTGYRVVIFLLALWMIGVASGSPGSAAEAPWELKKDESGIQVFVRPVEGSSILEYKGVMTVDAGMEPVIVFYEEDARMPEWFHQCAEAWLIEAATPDDKLVYFALDMPWPVKNRDCVFRRVRSKNPDTGVVEYTLTALPDRYPKQKGRIRMPYLKSCWRFTPLGANRTEIYYQSHSEVGGHIPSWLVNKLAVNIPFNSLSGFRNKMLNYKH